jgi:hypothetical protein
VAGQAVQAALALGVLVLLPSPVHDRLPARVGLGLAGAVVVVVLAAFVTSPGIVLASTVAVAGYVATYLLAAHAVGVTTPAARLLPLVVLVLVAAGLPFNVAGWGPREGMAAWAFGAAGSGAAAGVASAVAYGALVLVGSLPGVVALVVLARPRAAGPGPGDMVRTGGARG